MSCHVVSCSRHVRVMSSDIISCHLISSHLISSHLTSPHLTSPLTSPLISSHLISPHLTSSHLISSHLTSPHLTSPHLSPLTSQLSHLTSHLISSHVMSCQMEDIQPFFSNQPAKQKSRNVWVVYNWLKEGGENIPSTSTCASPCEFMVYLKLGLAASHEQAEHVPTARATAACVPD
eukprot:g49843.t1